MAEQDLKLRVSVDGAKQAAQDLQSVAAAQGQIKEAGSAPTPAPPPPIPKLDDFGAGAKNSAEEIRKLQEEFRNFVNTLPGGERVSRIIRLMNALGDGTITVGEAAKKAGQLLEGFSGGLKLLGAAGLVVAGIYAIAAAFKSVREETERATKAIQEQSDALTELQQKRGERRQSIEDIASQRKEGGFSDEQSRAAEETANSIRESFPFLSEDSVARAVGTFGGTSENPAGGRFDQAALTDAAILLQQGKLDLGAKGKSLDQLARKFERERSRSAAQIAIDREREQSQSGLGADKLLEDARTEVRSPDGPKGRTREFVTQQLGVGTPETKIDEVFNGIKSFDREAFDALVGLRGRDFAERGSPPEFLKILEALQLIASRQQAQGNVTNNTTIIGQQRQYNNGRQAQKEATSNGETRFANK